MLQLRGRAVEHLDRFVQQLETVAAARDQPRRSKRRAERPRCPPSARELELLHCPASSLVQLAQLAQGQGSLGAPGDERGVVAADGLEVASRPAHGSVAATSQPMEIGQWFNGALDEIRIYNRALSPAEIILDRQTPVDAAAPDGTYLNNLSAGVSIVGPGSVTSTVQLRQTGAGRYEGRFPAPAPG